MRSSVLPRAVALLREALVLRDPNWTQAELAASLGVTQQAVSGWLRGRCRPNPDAMVSIENLYGVPVRTWFETIVRIRRASRVEVARVS